MSKESMKEIMEQLKAAKSDEERKQILESGKTALTEDELEQVSGGSVEGSKRDLDRDYGRDWG